MKTRVKQSKRGRGAQHEIENEHAKLRNYLARLTTEKVGDGSDAYDYHPRVTFRMFTILSHIDRAMIGTPDYMGLAYWWDHEYKHTLREVTPKQRKKTHDAILAAGLPLDGVSDEHAAIIDRCTRPAKRGATK